MANAENAPSFIRSLATLLTGTVLAQAVPFLAAPLVARFYDAPQFALFGAMLAVFNVLNVVVTGRYELAVTGPTDRADAAHLVRGALLVCVGMTVVLHLALRLLHGTLETHMGLARLDDVLFVLSGLTLLAGVQLVLQQWMLRGRDFKAMARVKVVQALSITGLTLALGWTGRTDGLITGYLGGWTVFVLVTLWTVRRATPLPGAWDLQRSRAMLVRYKDWPLHNAWPAVLNAMASGGAVIYMGLFFDADTAGQHNFARQYLLAPIGMITVALGQLVLERTASHVRDGRPLGAELDRLMRMLALVALALAVLVTVAGPWLFTLVFGTAWATAGDYARPLIWGYAMQLVASPMGMVLIALGRVRLTMVFPLVYAALMVVPYFARHIEPMRFMILLSGIEVLAYGTYLMLVRSALRAHDQHLPDTR